MSPSVGLIHKTSVCLSNTQRSVYLIHKDVYLPYLSNSQDVYLPYLSNSQRRVSAVSKNKRESSEIQGHGIQWC